MAANEQTLTSMRRITLRVYGRVQGIGYRAAAHAKATGLGLSGWVRNRDDGSVELEVAGGRDDVGQFISWCQRGPAGASVTNIEVAEAPDAAFGGSFEVKPTV